MIEKNLGVNFCKTSAIMMQKLMIIKGNNKYSNVWIKAVWGNIFPIALIAIELLYS